MHSLETMRDLNNGKQEVLIFSVEQKILSDQENKTNVQFITAKLQSMGIGFKKLNGVYTHDNGTTVSETSFLVTGEHENLVNELCLQYNQECYLFSGDDRKSYLEYPSDIERRESIGTLQCVTERVAKATNAYSYDPTTNAYYICA